MIWAALGVLGIIALCALPIAAAAALQAATQTPAPAAADSVRMDARPVPGHTPGGAAGPPSPQTAPPGRGGIYGRLVMTTWFFGTGITVTDGHTRMRRFIDIPPADEWDGCPGCGRPSGTWCAPGCEYAKDTE